MVHSIHTTSPGITSSSLPRRRRGWVGAASIVGGALMSAGVFLPWLSLFAGLQSLNGLSGMNGPLFLIGGALGMLAGAVYVVRGTELMRWLCAMLGFGGLAGSGWLFIQLMQATRQLAADPFLVVRPGPGLLVIGVGAGLLFATLFLAPSTPNSSAD